MISVLDASFFGFGKRSLSLSLDWTHGNTQYLNNIIGNTPTGVLMAKLNLSWALCYFGSVVTFGVVAWIKLLMSDFRFLKSENSSEAED